MRKIFSLVAGLIVFIVLPLLGWGIGDIGGFVQNTFRLAYIVMMTVLSLLVVIFVPNEGRGYSQGEKIIKRQKYTILFLQIMPVLTLLISACFDRHNIAVINSSEGTRMIGLVMTFIGFSLMNWSVITLGRQFSVDVTIQENHKLITIGPYGYIRHPRYLGIILFLTGIPLVFNSWIFIITGALLVLVLMWRIKDEEKMMHEEFKGDWVEYKKSTHSLIPFIY
jgi:protein-S-isoprenylcysteine O-methyltransferase Ste14